MPIDKIKATDTDELFRKALNNFNTSDFESMKTAYVMFQEIVERDPYYRSPDGDNAYHYMGTFAKVCLENTKLAIEHYTKAMEVDPKDATSLHLRGLCWMEMNDYQQALSDLNEAVEIDDEGNGVLHDIGDHIQEAKNKLAEAMD